MAAMWTHQVSPMPMPQVRGNEVRVSGEHTARVAEVARLFEELVTLIQTGQQLDDSTLDRVFTMVASDERPSEILGHQILRGA